MGIVFYKIFRDVVGFLDYSELAFNQITDNIMIEEFLYNY
jgi:hypothetical protein